MNSPLPNCRQPLFRVSIQNRLGACAATTGTEGRLARGIASLVAAYFFGTSFTGRRGNLNGADSVVDKGGGAYLGGKVTGAAVGTGSPPLLLPTQQLDLNRGGHSRSPPRVRISWRG